MKECTSCGKYKLISGFHRRPNRVNGTSRCKTCRNTYSKNYRDAKPPKVNVVLIQPELDHYTPDYASMIYKLKLSTPIQDYSNSLTVGDCK